MSINGFLIDGVTHHYNYESLDNLPDFDGLDSDFNSLRDSYVKELKSRPASTESGNYSIIPGILLSNGSTSSGAASAQSRCRTNVIDISNSGSTVALYLEDNEYCIQRVWTYTEVWNSNGAHYANRQAQGESTNSPVIICRQEGDNAFVASFAKTDDPDHVMTPEDRDYISSKFRIRESNQFESTIETIIANVNASIGALSDSLAERTIYIYDPSSNFIIKYGGVSSNGQSSGVKNKLRYSGANNGPGAFKAGLGSTITPGSGYKCDVALYSYYHSNSDFVLEQYYSAVTSQLVIPYDCYVRVAFGTTSDDILWTKEDGIPSCTEAGLAAIENAVSINLIGGEVKTEVESLKESVATISENINSLAVNRLEDEIPLNALAYHTLYDGFVSSGKMTRTLLGLVDSDASLPIYMYTILNDMDHMDSGYAIVPYNGANRLYTRKKIFLDSGIHGNERSTPFVLYDFIKDLLEDPAYQDILNAFDWYFIPLVNPWGFGHTAIDNSTNEVNKGQGYTSSTLNNYTVVDNTASVHQGIRRNKDGIDINRDFETFATIEAQYVRDALASITADGSEFVFAMDSHQASVGNYVNAIGSFLSLHYGATSEAKNLIYNKWMQAGAKTEKLMADYCDVERQQSIYPWDGTSLKTLRNYLKDFSTYATCFEGGQNLAYYSGRSDFSNPIARTFINTQFHHFMRILLAEFM